MTERELRRIRDNVRHGGNMMNRHEEIGSGLVRVRDEIKRLTETLATQCEFFFRELERWTGRAELRTRPFVVGEQLREATAYLWAAIFGVAFDALTGGLLTRSIGLPFVVGAAISVLLVLILKGGIRFLFRDPARPLFVLERLRRQIVFWSLLVFLFGAMTLLSALRLSGAWAAALLPLYSVALLLTTLSLCILSACLWVAYQLLSWSRTAERSYSAIERQLREVRVLEHYLASLAPTVPVLSPGASIASTADNGAATGTGHAGNGRSAFPPVSGGPGLALMLLVLTGLASACTSVDAGPAATAPASAQSLVKAGPTASPGAEIDLWLDLSGSANPEALTEFARNVIRDLPVICRLTCAQRLHVRQIREDAWISPDVLTLTLPACPVAEPAATAFSEGEIASLPHIRAALEQASAEEGRKRLEEAERKYARDLNEALSAVSAERLVPTNLSPAPCSDIVGSLRRSLHGDGTPRLALVATDAEDSCSTTSHLPPLEAAPEVTTILFLVPARTAPLGWDEFEKRKAGLARLLPPGALVVPHFEEPGRAVQRAMAMKPS